jgi:hypothetical protein
MCLQFGFLIFWRKDFGAKAAHKMLVKLTQGHILGYQHLVPYLWKQPKHAYELGLLVLVLLRNLLV